MLLIASKCLMLLVHVDSVANANSKPVPITDVVLCASID